MEQQNSQMVRLISYNSSPMAEDKEEDISALSAFRTMEEEIKKKKMEVSMKVQAQLGRVEEETKRLAEIREVSMTVLQFYMNLHAHFLSTKNTSHFNNTTSLQ